MRGQGLEHCIIEGKTSPQAVCQQQSSSRSGQQTCGCNLQELPRRRRMQSIHEITRSNLALNEVYFIFEAEHPIIGIGNEMS
jgi:hypothetical protein